MIVLGFNAKEQRKRRPSGRRRPCFWPPSVAAARSQNDIAARGLLRRARARLAAATSDCISVRSASFGTHCPWYQRPAVHSARVP